MVSINQLFVTKIQKVDIDMQQIVSLGRWNPSPIADQWICDLASKLGVSPPKANDPIFTSLHKALVMRDDLADELAAWFKESKANSDIFDAYLAGDTSGLSTIPSVLQRLENELLSKRPAWACPEKMIVGANAHFRIGMPGRLASGTLGLLDGYRSAPVAKVLTMTGSLDSATAKRLQETTHFFNEIIMSDGMKRGSAGFRAALKVRLVHSFVRHGLAKSPRWDVDKWGMPINIMDSLGTAMSFWVPIVLGAPTFGYSVSEEEAEGMMTLWNYVGFLQGVPEELLPTTLAETYQVYLGILMQIGEPDGDSVKLAKAYIGAAAQRGGSSSWLNEKMVVGAAARLLPPSHRKELEVPNTLFRYWPDIFRPSIRKKDRECHKNSESYKAAVEEGRSLCALEMGVEMTAKGNYDPSKVIKDHSSLQGA